MPRKYWDFQEERGNEGRLMENVKEGRNAVIVWYGHLGKEPPIYGSTALT